MQTQAPSVQEHRVCVAGSKRVRTMTSGFSNSLQLQAVDTLHRKQNANCLWTFRCQSCWSWWRIELNWYVLESSITDHAKHGKINGEVCAQQSCPLSARPLPHSTFSWYAGLSGGIMKPAEEPAANRAQNSRGHPDLVSFPLL